MSGTIGIGAAITLIKMASELGYPKIREELERIGVENLMKLMGQDQKRRIYRYMYHNQPAEALKHLSHYPSAGQPAIYEDEEVTIQ